MALIIPHGIIKPFDPKSEIGVCVKCLEQTARWMVLLGDDELPWCARCFLYRTDWSEHNSAQRDRLIRDVEAQIGKSLIDAETKEILVEESDRILMSVVAISAYVHGRKINDSNRT